LDRAANHELSKMKEPDPRRISIVWHETAMMQIGKAGITDGLVKEAKRLLKSHKYIKVRALRSSRENASKEALFEELCRQAGATLVGVRGNTAVIYKL